MRLICLLCNLLDPDAKTQITLSELAHAQSSPKSFFFSVPGHLQCFILAGRGYCKTPKAQEVHFKAFQWACETRVSLEYFLVKVTLFVAHFLVYVSLKGAYLGMVSKILSPCTS